MHRTAMRAAATWSAALVFTGAAAAAENYQSSTVDADFGSIATDYSTFGDLLAGLQARPPGLQLPQNFGLRLRSIPGTLAGAVAAFGAGTLYAGQLQIPTLGVNTTFSGTSWASVLDQMRAFLTKGAVARALQREAVRSSPFDPVAGNPSSLMARAVAYDFASAFFAPFASNVGENEAKVAQATGLPAGALRGPMRALPGVGLYAGVLHDQGQTVKSLTLPLSYTLRSDLDPRRQFSISLPLTVTDVDGARSTQGTLAGTLRLPLAKDWALTTNLDYSMLTAKDLGSAGKIGSFSLVSSYVIRGSGSDFAIGNLIGYYRTLSGTVSGIDTASGIANTVFRNGVLWSLPAPAWLGGFGRSVELTATNTHYAGSELYLRNYSELGVSLGSNRRADSSRGYSQGGISYLFSSKTKGLAASWALWF